MKGVEGMDESWLWSGAMELLKRVAQLVFDQNVVTAYHNCATSGEISVWGREKSQRLVHESVWMFRAQTYFKNCGKIEVHPDRSCFKVRINSKVSTVLGSVLVEAIFRLCPISSSNSMIMLQPRMPQASSSLTTIISTAMRWRSSTGSRTSVHESKWRCLASRRVPIKMSATCWIASSLKEVGRWKMSSSSSWCDFVLFGGVRVAGVQLDPKRRRGRKKKRENQ